MRDFEEHIKTILKKQKSFFRDGKTLDLNFRLKALDCLYKKIIDLRPQINEALYKDLRKSEFEAIATETSGVLEDILYTRKNLRKWAKPQRVPVHINNFPAKGRIFAEPYGSVLIFSAWNYPFQLALAPMIAAIAAGNCVVLKTSEQSPATAEILKTLIESCFKSKHAAVINGGIAEAEILLKRKFDYLFYTGGPNGGRHVMHAAAKRLTPVTLELGGKSPCIVAADADLEVTAKRIVWGKYMNAGQTCVAPDYLLVHEKIKAPLMEKMQLVIKNFYGENPQESNDYPRIINKAHFERLRRLLDGHKVHTGGKHDIEDLYLEPTIVDNPTLDSELMEHEIFGPILPVITWRHFDEVLEFVNERPKPLAMYCFTKCANFTSKLTACTSAGGVTVNDTITHFINPSMPFGGVGESGIGAYHGKFGFDTFSHYKPVMYKSFFLDIPLRYPPFKDKLNILKKLCR